MKRNYMIKVTFARVMANVIKNTKKWNMKHLTKKKNYVKGTNNCVKHNVRWKTTTKIIHSIQKSFTSKH